MRRPHLLAMIAGLLQITVLGSVGHCGAFDDAEEWGGYWRRSEPRFGRRYQVPPTLYYGHAPPVDQDLTAPRSGEGPLYRRIPPTPESGAQHVAPYHPQFYGRGRYFGPSIDPYYAPGRASYGGYRYGWW